MRKAILVLAVLMLGSAFTSSSLAQKRRHEAPQDTPSIKLSTELVSLSVAVTDQKGQAIKGLKKEDFKVYENGVEQTIGFFSAEDSPISWGLVLDRSDTKRKIMDDVYHAAFHVIYERAERDEAFLVAFDDQVEMVSDFTSNYGQLMSALRRVRPGRRSALYDAVAFALDHIRQGKNRKKALLVISEGGDDSSQIAFRQLLERASRRGILIYTVGLTESLSPRRLRTKGGRWRRELKQLAEATGAHAHFPSDMPQCEEAMKAMVEEFGRQYCLEYRSNNPARDGKWREVRVVAGQSNSNIGYAVRARAGYYAPKAEEVKEP